MSQLQEKQYLDNVASIEAIKVRLDAAEKSRSELREDIRRMFEKLDTINVALSILQSVPRCTDPGACTRLEVALVDHNRRLIKLELARSYTLGERTTILVLGSLIGIIFGWLIEWYHKS